MSLKEAPSGNRMERKKEETKKKIIDVAIHLFNEQGVDATSMEQIAMEVDIAKGTLYNYFSAKEAIISAFIQNRFSNKNIDRLMAFKEQPDTRCRMIYIFKELIAGIEENKELFEKYLVYRMQSMVSFQENENQASGFSSLGEAVIKMGQKSGEIRNDIPLEVLKELFEFIFIEIVKSFYSDNGFNSEETIMKYTDLFICGTQNGEI